MKIYGQNLVNILKFIYFAGQLWSFITAAAAMNGSMELAVRPSCSTSGCCGHLGRRLDLVEAKVLPHSSNEVPDSLMVW